MYEIQKQHKISNYNKPKRLTYVNCNDPPTTIQYCPLLVPPNQTSQEFTYPSTTLAEARLTAEFWLVHGHHGFKTHCVKNGAFIHISTSPFPGNVGCNNHLLLAPSVLAGDGHGILSFLGTQRVPAGNPHGLVHNPPISGSTMALTPFAVTTHFFFIQHIKWTITVARWCVAKPTYGTYPIICTW